jgi:NodT family efflux transporter outer membrane factor (OMF) lipoprotein
MPLLNKHPFPRVALALALSTALCACKTVGPNFTTPPAPSTPGYTMAGDKAAPRVVSGSAAAGAWWTAFGSPELDKAVKQALAENPTLAEADSTLEQMRQQANQVRGELGPQADANAGIQGERINIAAFGFSGFPNPTIGLYSIGGAVSYDLDLFGGGRRRLENAQAKAQAEAERANAAYLTISGDVALEAVEIARARGQIAAVQAMIADDQQNVDLARKAEALGGAAHSAGLSAQAQLSQDQALMPPLEQQLAEHRHMLSLLVGRTPADYTAPDFDLASLKLPDSIPVELPSGLVRKRPDILAAEADLHAATAQIGVETAKLYPDIRLNAALTQSALQPGTLFNYNSSGWNVGAGLTAPLFNGGALRANKKAAEAAARASLARYEATVGRAFGEVADLLQALANDENEINALAAAQADAEADLHDQRVAFDNGAGTIVQLIDAQRRLHSARRGLAQAQGQRLADAVELFVATGADWRSPPTK